jgi:hypothetical protein
MVMGFVVVFICGTAFLIVAGPQPQNSLGKVVEKALQDALGWKSNSDSSGFTFALSQSFNTGSSAQRHVQSTWTPRKPVKKPAQKSRTN